jgi:hypothetical protein
MASEALCPSLRFVECRFRVAESAVAVSKDVFGCPKNLHVARPGSPIFLCVTTPMRCDLPVFTLVSQLLYKSTSTSIQYLNLPIVHKTASDFPPCHTSPPSRTAANPQNRPTPQPPESLCFPHTTRSNNGPNDTRPSTKSAASRHQTQRRVQAAAAIRRDLHRQSHLGHGAERGPAPGRSNAQPGAPPPRVRARGQLDRRRVDSGRRIREQQKCPLPSAIPYHPS